MSIKKFNFLADLSLISEWGQSGQPFVALVDFEGHWLAQKLPDPGVLSGCVQLDDAALHFSFNDALRSGMPAMEFHSRQAFQVENPPERQPILDGITALQAEMRAGRSYLVNYCSQTVVRPLAEPRKLYENSAAPYNFWLEGHFLSFSPESFVTVTGSTIRTTPMKGTGFDRAGLLHDEKEMAEHATVVDLLRNDLGRVASNIRLGDFRFVTEIRRADGRILYQTSSDILGSLPGNWRSTMGEWLPHLLPAGSISGAPKRETIALIRRFEREPRGFFTGVAFCFDGQNLYSAVLIRFIDISAPQWKFRSGAGITIYSNPESEYEEILQKVYFPT